MTQPSFETLLTGGHPNSLGNTLAVVEQILANKERLEDLLRCYASDNEVVRLRTSNALKRVTKAHPGWVAPYLERLLGDIAEIDQASTRWTLAQVFLDLEPYLSSAQKTKAKTLLKHNLSVSDDWIVIINTLETLTSWAKDDHDLRTWLKPHLIRYAQDSRKAVSGKAKKLKATL